MYCLYYLLCSKKKKILPDFQKSLPYTRVPAQVTHCLKLTPRRVRIKFHLKNIIIIQQQTFLIVWRSCLLWYYLFRRIYWPPIYVPHCLLHWVKIACNYWFNVKWVKNYNLLSDNIVNYEVVRGRDGDVMVTTNIICDTTNMICDITTNLSTTI